MSTTSMIDFFPLWSQSAIPITLTIVRSKDGVTLALKVSIQRLLNTKR